MTRCNTAYNYDTIDPSQGFDESYDKDCHMQDDDYDYDEVLPSLENLSLHDLMGEDHGLYLKQNHNGTYDLEISDENAKPIFSDQNIHRFAIDSLALFCKRFMRSYSRFNPSVQGE